MELWGSGGRYHITLLQGNTYLRIICGTYLRGCFTSLRCDLTCLGSFQILIWYVTRCESRFYILNILNQKGREQTPKFASRGLIFVVYSMMCCWVFPLLVHPWNSTWNLKKHPWKGKLLYKLSILRFQPLVFWRRIQFWLFQIIFVCNINIYKVGPKN